MPGDSSSKLTTAPRAPQGRCNYVGGVEVPPGPSEAVPPAWGVGGAVWLARARMPESRGGSACSNSWGTPAREYQHHTPGKVPGDLRRGPGTSPAGGGGDCPQNGTGELPGGAWGELQKREGGSLGKRRRGPSENEGGGGVREPSPINGGRGSSINPGNTGAGVSINRLHLPPVNVPGGMLDKSLVGRGDEGSRGVWSTDHSALCEGAGQKAWGVLPFGPACPGHYPLPLLAGVLQLGSTTLGTDGARAHRPPQTVSSAPLPWSRHL